jgi:DNA-binding transcriptional ArsR family regulator
MPAPTFHPKAYLITRRNVTRGLRARTKILELIEKKSVQTSRIAEETGLSYRSVGYHINVLRKEKIMEPTSRRRPLTWRLTSLGQQRLA